MVLADNRASAKHQKPSICSCGPRRARTRRAVAHELVRQAEASESKQTITGVFIGRDQFHLLVDSPLCGRRCPAWRCRWGDHLADHVALTADSSDDCRSCPSRAAPMCFAALLLTPCCALPANARLVHFDDAHQLSEVVDLSSRRGCACTYTTRFHKQPIPGVRSIWRGTHALFAVEHIEQRHRTTSEAGTSVFSKIVPVMIEKRYPFFAHT